MTRFDADDPAGRRKLVAEAVRAHRERASAYLTLQADAAVVVGTPGEATEGDTVPATREDERPAEPPPWVQLSGDVVNLDCTDEELDRLEDLLVEFPAFKIREMESPEEAEGTNVRVGAKADPARIGQFVDRVFGDVYGLPEEFRLWVAEV